MNTKNNQRFRDTEIDLEKATLELMKKKNIDKITVSAICEKAGINRSTFYAHFTDVYDLFDKMEIEMRRGVMERYFSDKETYQVFSANSFLPLFTHIKENAFFYQVVLQTRKNFPITQGFDPLWNNIFKPRCEEAGITDEEEIMYYFVFFQAGFTMCLRRWVDGGCQESEQELAGIISKCVPEFMLIR